MDESERKSLTVQIQECYSHLRNFGSGNSQMFVASADDWLTDTLRIKGCDRWAIHLSDDPIERIASHLGLNLILMSPDATEELSAEDIADTKNLFVIGGIVDRIVSKNETSHKAIRLGILSRKLPMDSNLIRNRVFNIDSVFMFLIQCCNLHVKSRESILKILDDILPDRKRGIDQGTVKKTPQKQPCLPGVEEDTYEGNTVKLDSYSIVDLFR
jgi:hypothetical protein